MSEEKKKKIFRVPCVWEMYGYTEVEAEDWDDAVDKAPLSGLPDDGSYVFASFKVDDLTVDEFMEYGFDGVPVGETNMVIKCVVYPEGGDRDKYREIVVCTHHSVPKGYTDGEIFCYEVPLEEVRRSMDTDKPTFDDTYVVIDYEVKSP